MYYILSNLHFQIFPSESLYIVNNEFILKNNSYSTDKIYKKNTPTETVRVTFDYKMTIQLKGMKHNTCITRIGWNKRATQVYRISWAK